MRKRNISFVADKLLWFIILILPLLFAMVFTCASMNNYELEVNNQELDFVDYQYTSFIDGSDSSAIFYDNGSTSIEYNLLYIPSSVLTFYMYWGSDGVLEFNRSSSLSDFYDIGGDYDLCFIDFKSVNSNYESYLISDTFIKSFVADTYEYEVSIGSISLGYVDITFSCEDSSPVYYYNGSLAELPSNDNIFKTYFNNLNYSLDSWFTFGENDIVYSAFNSIFGSQSNILPIFVEGSFIPKYLTYMAWIYVLHIAFDLLVFIPRLAHKWMGGVYKDEDS